MVEAGHEVTTLAPKGDTDSIQMLSSIGVNFIQIPMKRAAISPFYDLLTLIAISKILRSINPDTILTYTMKPIVYGCLAGRLTRVPNRFAMITGLGYLFNNAGNGIRLTLLRHASIWMHRIALPGVKRVFVYNTADAHDIRHHKMVDDDSHIQMILGSGVALDHFTESKPPLEPLTFLLIARMLREKGIFEYIDAARLLRQRYPGIRVQLLGPLDSNPSGISREMIENMTKDSGVEYLGVTRDVRPFLRDCTVFVLPTYYREGIPRAILEAMATGRPIITTDTPGCRETVIEGENGFLIPPRDSQRLLEVMTMFATEPQLAIGMGKRSRQLAVDLFDVNIINQQLLTAMNLV